MIRYRLSIICWNQRTESNSSAEDKEPAADASRSRTLEGAGQRLEFSGSKLHRSRSKSMFYVEPCNVEHRTQNGSWVLCREHWSVGKYSVAEFFHSAGFWFMMEHLLWRTFPAEHWLITLYMSALWSVLVLVYIKRPATNAKAWESEDLETPVCSVKN